MAIVVNTLLPVPARRTVRARLIAPVGWYVTAAEEIAEVVTGWTATIGDNGDWELDLPPNAAYDAENTYYRVDEPGAVHTCVVPAGPGPVELHDIAITDPAATPCCPPPPAGSVADGARTLEELLDVEGTDAAQPGDTLIRSVDGPWRPGNPITGSGYEHLQTVPANEWVMAHPLPFTPNVTLISSTHRRVFAELTYDPDAPVVTARFGDRVLSGRAVFS